MKRFIVEQFDFPVSDNTKQEIEFFLLREKLIYDTKEELYCSGRYRDFFEHYNEESIHSFIDEFAKRRADYVLKGKQLLSEQENAQLYFRSLAENYIWEIQQKKLFDMQCLWRAGKIKLKEMEVSRDFLFEEINIKNCKAIRKITKEELSIYIDYMLSDYCSEKEHTCRWQDYNFIKSGVLKHGYNAMPAWYTFYDKAIGSENLLSLPDIKGEKENEYLLAARQNALALQPPFEYEMDERPDLKFNFKTLEFFVTTFEDKSLFKYFYASEKTNPDIDDNRGLNEALRLLGLCNDPVSIEAGADWKLQVIEAAKKTRKKKITEALLSVFNEYCLRLKTKLSFSDDATETRLQLMARKVESYKNEILRGRKQKGESQDFDF